MHEEPFIVLGVDPAKTRLAAVASKVGGFQIFTRTMPDDVSLGCSKAREWIFKIVRGLQRDQIDAEVWVFIERPVVGVGGVNATLQQAFVNGALQGGAVDAGAHRVVLVNNSTMKKVVLGNGGAKKPDMAAHVKKTWPKLYVEAKGNQDVIDSAVVAEYGDQFIKAKRKRKFRRG